MAPTWFDPIKRLLPSFLSWAEWSKDKEPAQAPEEGYYSSGIRDDYLINASTRELNPERLARALKLAEMGYTYDWFDCCDIIEQDPQVTANLGRRRDAVTGRDMAIMPALEVDTAAEEAADMCRELVIGDDQGVDGIADWPSALFNMTDAVGKAVALQQIAWQVRGGVYVPGELVRWPQREIIFGDQPAIAMLQGNNPDQIRIRTRQNLAWGEPLQPRWNWVVHVQKQWTTHLSRAGLMRSIAWFWMFKRFSFRDWSIFIERYGMPLRVGKYHLNASQTERDALLASVLKLGRDSACIMPQQSTIELLQSSMAATSSEPHEQMKEAANDEIARAIWGNTMSSTQGDRGARSAKEAFSADEKAITNKDCRNLAETIRRELLTPLVRLNLGDNVPVPRVRFNPIAEVNKLEEAQVDKILIADVGLELSKSELYERYGRQEPLDDEDRLKKAPPPPNPFAKPPAPGQEGEDGEQEVPPAGDLEDQGEGGEEPDMELSDQRLSELVALDVASYARARKRSADWVIARLLNRQGENR